MDMAARERVARQGARGLHPSPGRRRDHRSGGVGTLVLGLAAAALGRRTPRRRRPERPVPVRTAHVRAAQRLSRAAGLLAISVLADSAVEHYRGSFHNRAMYAPLVSALLSLAASGHGSGDERAAAHRARDAAYAAALVVGAAGTAFHVYNVGKREGGVSWHNLFYAAPLGAPAALSLSGLLGLTAERARDNPEHPAPTVVGLPAGRVMAAVTAAGLVGTIAEVGLLHFRGAYHNPLMYLPVTIPPISAALLIAAALGERRARPLVYRWLQLTAGLGIAGAGLHAVGVARNMGGWRNWSQNILNGPPLPAPPSFTALSLAGLGALDLLEETEDA